jgi:hypothetical protein
MHLDQSPTAEKLSKSFTKESPSNQERFSADSELMPARIASKGQETLRMSPDERLVRELTENPLDVKNALIKDPSPLASSNPSEQENRTTVAFGALIGTLNRATDQVLSSPKMQEYVGKFQEFASRITDPETRGELILAAAEQSLLDKLGAKQKGLTPPIRALLPFMMQELTKAHVSAMASENIANDGSIFRFGQGYQALINHLPKGRESNEVINSAKKAALKHQSQEMQKKISDFLEVAPLL